MVEPISINNFQFPQVAVIADAGRATRFLPATKVGAKSLIPVGDKPVLLWLLKEIKESGIKEVIIVANRYNAPFISKFIEYDKDLLEYLKNKNKTHLLKEYFEILEALDIEIVIQPKILGYGNAVPILATRNLIGNRYFAYIFGDDLVFYKDKPPLLQLIEKGRKFSNGYKVTGSFIVEEVPWDVVHKYGVVKYKQQLDTETHLMELVVEKPSKEEAPSNLVSFGRYIFSPEIFEALDSYKDEVNKSMPEYYIQPAMTILAKNSAQLAVNTNKTKWVTTGDPVNMYNAWKEWFENYREL